jgi:hypothetical protein
MIIKHLPPNLVESISRFTEERNLAREALALEKLRHPPVKVDHFNPGRPGIEMGRAQCPQVRLDVMGEARREGGEQDPLARPSRILLDLVCQVLRSVHCDN